MNSWYLGAPAPTTWVPLGETIPSDNSAPVGLSSDGKHLYVGARVYTRSGSQWELLRGDVAGESYGSNSGYWDQYGNYQGPSQSQSMCMSSDSSHAAFGADNKVRVYEWKSDAWARKGDELVGANGFGSSVSLSKDGSRLAVGSPSHPSENCTTGAVNVYEWKGGSNSWVQMGESMFCYNRTDDQVGKSISLSGDGSRVAIGAPQFSGPDRCDYYGCWVTNQYMGRVRVYEWNPSDGMWPLRIASYTPGLESIDGSSGRHQKLGTSVALSDDGKRLLIGTGSKALTYNWMDLMTVNDWQGNPVEVGGWVGYATGCSTSLGSQPVSVSTSPDGKLIAAGSSSFGILTLGWEHGDWNMNGVNGIYLPEYTGKFLPLGFTNSYEFEMSGSGGLTDKTCNPSCWSCNCNSFGSAFAIAGDDMSTRVAVRSSSGVQVFHVTYCDTTIPPENGDIGDCPSRLAPGQYCQTNCSAGFASTGPSECNVQGQLTPGMCLVTTTIEGDQGFGSSVVLSDDGYTAAVLSSPGPGDVKVYGYGSTGG